MVRCRSLCCLTAAHRLRAASAMAFRPGALNFRLGAAGFPFAFLIAPNASSARPRFSFGRRCSSCASEESVAEIHSTQRAGQLLLNARDRSIELCLLSLIANQRHRQQVPVEKFGFRPALSLVELQQEGKEMDVSGFPGSKPCPKRPRWRIG